MGAFDLIRGLLNRRVKERATRMQTLQELARKEAIGKASKADVEALDDALRVSGKTLDDFRTMVSVYREHAEHESEAKAAEKRAAEVKKARDALRTWPARREAFVQEIDVKGVELDRASRKAEANYRKAQGARGRQQVIEFQHPELFGTGPLNLDEFTLTVAAGSHAARSIVVHDPSSVTHEVDSRTFHNEERRRQQMLITENQRRSEAYAAAIEAWKGTAPDMKGNPTGKFPDPPELLKSTDWAKLREVAS